MSTTFDIRRWATQAGIQTTGGFAVIAECVTMDELQRFAEIAIASAGGVQALSAAPAEQQAQLGAVYAELGCDEVSRVVDVVVERCISLTQDATGIKVVYDPIILGDALLTELRDFADRTHALRMQAAPKAAPGELHDHQILAITTAYEQGVGKGLQAYGSGKEIANPYSPAYGCDLAWQYGYKEGKKQAAPKAAPGEPDRADATNPARIAIEYPDLQLTVKGIRCLADAVLEMDKYIAEAPQQEAQEPVLATYTLPPLPEPDLRDVGTRPQDLKDYLRGYATEYAKQALQFSQPAPAPLSDDTVLLDGLARLNWYVGPGDFYCDEAGGMNDYDDKNSGPEELRQAIRAALAAQGGK